MATAAGCRKALVNAGWAICLPSCILSVGRGKARGMYTLHSLMSRPNPHTRKGSGVISLNPSACGSVEVLLLLV